MSKDPLLEKFEIRIPVKEDDIDRNGHVNNTVYLRWVQDVAIAHWEAAAAEKYKSQIVWVVTRLEIDYKLPLYMGDEIIARTWVGQSSELKFERHTEIIRTADMKLAAKSRTLWVPVNIKTGKPARVDEELRNRFSVK